MAYKIFIYLCLSVIIGAYGRYDRIIGGEDADRTDFPYLVSIRLTTLNKHLCSGSIIVEEAILTAAHCLYKLETLMPYIAVHAGASNLTDLGSVHKIRKAILHPDFSGNRNGKNGYHHDIAIIIVKEPFGTNSFQDYISLPSERVSLGESVTMCGWGLTSLSKRSVPTRIQHALVELTDCAEYENIFRSYSFFNQICTIRNQVRACTGDSGGPVVKNGNIIGIISFSKLCDANVPDIHTDVYAYMGFIISALHEEL